MASEVCICSTCLSAFNEDERRPKILSCFKHTLCLKCLKSMKEEYTYIWCPDCQMSFSDIPEKLHDNCSVMTMLENTNLKCPQHDTHAVSYCIDHFTLLCSLCTDHAACELLDIVKDQHEINFCVIEKIKKLQRSLEAMGKYLPPSIALKMRNCRKERLKANISTYLFLNELTPQGICENCNKKQNLFLQKCDFLILCDSCITEGAALSEFIMLKDEDEAKEKMLPLVKDKLKKVNVEELDDRMLRGFKVMQSLSPFDIISLTKQLFRKGGNKTSYQDLPSEFRCLGCCQLLKKSSSQIRELGCAGMHVICEECCSSMSFNKTICPLDGKIFEVPPKSLPLHPSPQDLAQIPPAYQAPEYSSMQHYQSPAYDAQAAEPQYNPALGYPMQIQYELQVGPPPQDPIPPLPGNQPLSETIRGTSLPPLPPCGIELQSVDLFSEVLPKFGLPEYLMTAATKGWTVECAHNQVEAMVIMLSEGAILQGISVSNPVTPGVVAKLKFIKIYSSRVAKGHPIFEQSPNLDLVGGESVLTDVPLSQPMYLPSYQPLSIKIKIEAPADYGDMMLYNGHSPNDVFVSSGGQLWDFDRVRAEDLDSGEYSSGQVPARGPILRVIYSAY